MKKHPEPKQLFLDRMKELLGEKEVEVYLKILEQEPIKSIRCNTIKISAEELKKRLIEKSWKVSQPWKCNPEVMIINSDLLPGELGNALEHLLGYYYIQELASMLPLIALNPQSKEFVLDLCASPGSKTTQASALMKNSGLIIANEISLRRIKILSSNLERCGVCNAIITRKEGVAACERLKKFYPELKFDKILIDAPCSGEGTLRSTPKNYLMWNINTIKQLSGLQKKMVAAAVELLKIGGELVYSTCTHAPEENEEIVDFILRNFPDMKIQNLKLPIKSRKGITEWLGKKYLKETENSCRIYPQDNNTEGFFLAKFRRVK